VGDLQCLIETATGVERGEQRLVFGGFSLSPCKHLGEYGIVPGGGQTVHLLGSLAGGMPATAPRIKMPANNRMHSSAALRTTRYGAAGGAPDGGMLATSYRNHNQEAA